MTDKEKELVEKMVSGLAEYFKYDIQDFILKMYTDILFEKPYADAVTAVKHFFKAGSKMPLLVNFTEYFNTNGVNINALCEIKWERLMRIINKCGSYVSWTDKDPAFRRAVEAVGYENVCQAEANELKWVKKDFFKAYVSFSILTLGSYETKKYFKGFIEIDNANISKLPAYGYSGDKIVFMNDKDEFVFMNIDKIDAFLKDKKCEGELIHSKVVRNMPVKRTHYNLSVV